MRIYSMTATFGKLEHQTLTLQPGLQVIHAPNEWGKSTWCAFLVTMLYGLDTRERTKRGSLADKERYAPWSGSPMSGRIDLNWNGRDITIERRTKGRIPMGELTAYETATGLPVPELTAANCGQVLLGVERSVFVRAGFIRSSEMPVTQDEELRHRLNALVTTGDESLAAEALGQKLRDLKNSCRYNRSGLLPEAEGQRKALEEKLEEHRRLTEQSRQLQAQQEQLDETVALLNNHQAALRHAAALSDARQVEQAAQAVSAANTQYQRALSACDGLPSREEAAAILNSQNALRRQWDDLQAQERLHPPAPQPPQPPEVFRGMTPEEAVVKAQADRSKAEAVGQPERSFCLPLTVLALLLAAAGIVLTVIHRNIPGLLLLAVGLVLGVIALLSGSKHRKRAAQHRQQHDSLCRHYGTDDPAQWVANALAYQQAQNQYLQADTDYRSMRADLDSRRRQLSRQMEESLSADPKAWMDAWDALENSRRNLAQAQGYWETLNAMAKDAPPAPLPDLLTHSAEETEQLLSKVALDRQLLQHRLGQCQGQMARLGSQELLQQELDSVCARIRNLELTYHALELGLNALTAARAQLQRRFAPRLTQQAQELFSRLTGGRYQRLTLAEDLSIHAGAEQEDTLRGHLWRSEGTVDQLYLALRLAVARELTPDAPLILDDALIRFDEERLESAMDILRQEAQTKQVIVFTCQGREKA